MDRLTQSLEKLEKQLNLKKLQIKSLMSITQAINANSKAPELYKMYSNFLSWDMTIEKMALLIKENNGWRCATNIKCDHIDESIIPHIIQYKRLHNVKEYDHKMVQEFDIIIPVYHKEEAIAYSLIGGLKDHLQDDLYNKIQFIITITNIIVVAIENKRLFKRQLKQEMYNREMELAGEVQRMLIPQSLPHNERYCLSKIYRPHSNIGGDYVDFIKFSENKFVMCIADISGKGIAAALLMANFQAIMRNLIFTYRDLETFVFALNEKVFEITKDEKYITFFIAKIDLENNEIRYINSGHYPPVMVMGDKLSRLTKGSTFIGAFERLPNIEEEVIKITDDTFILCFTDGLVELENDKYERFDDRKIESFVAANAHLDTDTFNDRFQQEIDQFRGAAEYQDDVAILTCKVKKR